jgi:hypothetical protein
MKPLIADIVPPFSGVYLFNALAGRCCMFSARHWALVFSALTVVTLSVSADHPQLQTGNIVEAGHMLSPRSGHSATRLHDGRVLIVGGMVRNGQFLDTAELYDPGKKTFIPTGTMTIRRVGHAAALLHDGRVLIVGGWVGGATDRAELYNPQTGRFTPSHPCMGLADALPLQRSQTAAC